MNVFNSDNQYSMNIYTTFLHENKLTWLFFNCKERAVLKPPIYIGQISDKGGESVYSKHWQDITDPTSLLPWYICCDASYTFIDLATDRTISLKITSSS